MLEVETLGTIENSHCLPTSSPNTRKNEIFEMCWVTASSTRSTLTREGSESQNEHRFVISNIRVNEDIFT